MSTPAPRWIAKLAAFNAFMSTEVFGGPRVLKLSWVINAQKAGTALWVAAWMAHYNRFTPEAWVYLALHGTYGVLWLLKDVTFPDPRWQRRVTFGGAFFSVALVLGPYWSFSWLMLSDAARAPASGTGLALAIALHTVGVALMLGADAQKYFTLKLERGLIETGFFRYVRHPNYSGEMLLYGSYALLVGHWFPWAVLAWVWLGVFLPNMLMKEASMSRYPGWAAYKARTGMLWPRLGAWLGGRKLQRLPAPTSVASK